MNPDPARILCYLVTNARRRRSRWDSAHDIGRLPSARARPPTSGTSPEAAGGRSGSTACCSASRVTADVAGGASLTPSAGSQSVREVRVAGQTVHRAGEPLVGPSRMTVAELSTSDRTEFVSALGWIFEESSVGRRTRLATASVSRPLDELHASHDARRRRRDGGRTTGVAACASGPRHARACAATRQRANSAARDSIDSTPDEFAPAAAPEHGLSQPLRISVSLRGQGARTTHDVLTALDARAGAHATRSSRTALQQVHKIARFRPGRADRGLNCGATVERTKGSLLRQGRRHGLPADSRRARSGRSQYGLRRGGEDAHVGRAFWPTYLRGDNTGLIATDSMKNFIHRETFSFIEFGLENYRRFIGRKFLDAYSQVAKGCS